MGGQQPAQRGPPARVLGKARHQGAVQAACQARQAGGPAQAAAQPAPTPPVHLRRTLPHLTHSPDPLPPQTARW